MNNIKKVLLLVGSPKGPNSTSESLGNYLLTCLEKKGLETEKLYIYRLIKNEDGKNKLYSIIESSDLLILACPLYIDCLPAPVIRAMEFIARKRSNNDNRTKQNFIGIVNCGFPESKQNKTALSICKIFASEVGFEWKGGLAVGMGGAIAGIALEERGGMVRNVVKGLNIAADALAEAKDIPKKAIDLVGKKFFPYRMYTFIGDISWKLQAKKFGVRKRLKDKPF